MEKETILTKKLNTLKTENNIYMKVIFFLLKCHSK